MIFFKKRSEGTLCSPDMRISCGKLWAQILIPALEFHFCWCAVCLTPSDCHHISTSKSEMAFLLWGLHTHTHTHTLRMDSGRIDDQREMCGFALTNKADVQIGSLSSLQERPSPYKLLLHLIYRNLLIILSFSLINRVYAHCRR